MMIGCAKCGSPIQLTPTWAKKIEPVKAEAWPASAELLPFGQHPDGNFMICHDCYVTLAEATIRDGRDVSALGTLH